MVTYDAALSVHVANEVTIADRVRSTIAANKNSWHSLPKPGPKRNARLRRLLAASAIPDAKDVEVVGKWLQDQEII